jgi:DNA-binding beta-propeller fold protein YncE
MRWLLVPVLAVPLLASSAGADVVVPPGFTTGIYVTGEGFDPGIARGGRGMPAAGTIAVDHAGVLYLARTGRRYFGGEADDLWPIYRIPPGGGRVTPDTEAGYLYGPPLRSAQVTGFDAGGGLLVTTYDRERRIGVLYRMLDGHAELFAGGTPPRGAPPVLAQPEGVARDSSGHLYVADRAQDRVVRLDRDGEVRDLHWVIVRRPRLLAVDGADRLWVASDGEADAPWQQGPGEIRRVDPDGDAAVVMRGPLVAGFAVSPGGHLFVADRQNAVVFVLMPDGRRIPFARFTAADAPRALAFAPITPETRRAGLAGDLFVVVINRGAWPINEVVRISGPFAEFVRAHRGVP